MLGLSKNENNKNLNKKMLLSLTGSAIASFIFLPTVSAIDMLEVERWAVPKVRASLRSDNASDIPHKLASENDGLLLGFEVGGEFSGYEPEGRTTTPTPTSSPVLSDFFSAGVGVKGNDRLRAKLKELFFPEEVLEIRHIEWLNKAASLLDEDDDDQGEVAVAVPVDADEKDQEEVVAPLPPANDDGLFFDLEL